MIIDQNWTCGTEINRRNGQHCKKQEKTDKIF